MVGKPIFAVDLSGQGDCGQVSDFCRGYTSGIPVMFDLAPLPPSQNVDILAR